MSKEIEKREYVDGPRRLIASIRDNGCVAFSIRSDASTSGDPAVSSDVLRQLADLADQAKGK